MKNIFLLTAVLFLSAFAQESPVAKTETPYKTGEFFKFKLSYSRFLTAGYATMELTEATYNNKSVYYAKGYGANTGLSKAFFKVEDHYQSYFDKETGKPYMAVRNVSEGNYRRNQRAYFNFNSNTVFLRNLIKNRDKVIDVPVNVQDVVSMFYYFRNHKDIDKLKEGQSIEVDMFFDDEIMKFKLKFIGREVVKTKFGQVPAMVFRPMVQAGRVFKEEESLTVWISDDKNKVPLRIKADIVIGSINADLTEYSGLKYPLNILSK
ncbi:MAG: DUF3108 domain-containing protein [Flavobacteriaceae bacterium]